MNNQLQVIQSVIDITLSNRLAERLCISGNVRIDPIGNAEDDGFFYTIRIQMYDPETGNCTFSEICIPFGHQASTDMKLLADMIKAKTFEVIDSSFKDNRTLKQEDKK